MSGSIQKIVAVIDGMNFRRAMVESFFAAWAKHESVDLISIPPEQARAKLGGDMDCRMLIYFVARGPSFSPEVLGEIQELQALRPAAALVIVSDDDSLDGVSAAINAGTQGYFDIAMQPELALQALSFVLHGGTYFPPPAILAGHSGAASPYHGCDADDDNGQQGDPAPPVKRSDYDHAETNIRALTLVGKQDAGAKTAHPQMTARQEAVIACLCVGDSNKAIARKLGMTETTVKVHMREVMRKLGVSNRTQVAIIAARDGLASHSRLLCQDTSDGAAS
jgi:DNA-binding NarL/FixJ family response regulator